jgi:hypothetical protein
MASFDDRRDTFERKFAHDEELLFKATARRNKLFGLWAARQLGKTASDAELAGVLSGLMNEAIEQIKAEP